MRLILWIGCFILSSTALSSRRDKPFILTYYDHRKLTQNASNSSCMSLDQMVDHSLKYSFDSQVDAEKLYQARQIIGTKLGALTPGINIGNVLQGLAGGLFEVVPSLVGFAFPSNWFDWEKSRFLYEAQRYSYKTMLANQVNTIESLYYNIHMQLIASDILNHYTRSITRVIQRIHRQERKFKRQINREMMGNLLSIKERLNYDMQDIDQVVHQVLPQLAYGINYHGPWDHFCIQNIALQQPRKSFILHPQRFIPEMNFKSPELTNIEFMHEAAKSARKSTRFKFLLPEGGDNKLGLSYYYELKLAQSEVDEIAVNVDKTKASLKLSLFNAMNLQNASLDSYIVAKDGLKVLNGLKEALVATIENYDEKFDFEKAIRFFDYALTAELRINLNHHANILGQTRINRLLWEGRHYQTIDERLPPQKIPAPRSIDWNQ